MLLCVYDHYTLFLREYYEFFEYYTDNSFVKKYFSRFVIHGIPATIHRLYAVTRLRHNECKYRIYFCADSRKYVNQVFEIHNNNIKNAVFLSAISSEKLIALNILREGVPAWYSFHS